MLVLLSHLIAKNKKLAKGTVLVVFHQYKSYNEQLLKESVVKKSFRSPILILGLLVLTTVNSTRAEEWFVGPTSAGTGDGLSWANRGDGVAFVNANTVVGDTVRFGVGRYTGTRLDPPNNSGTDTTFYACSTWVSTDNQGSDSWNTAIITGAEVVTGWSQPGDYSGTNIYVTTTWGGGTLEVGNSSMPHLAAVTWGTTDSLLKPNYTGTVALTGVTEGESYYDDVNDSLFVWLNGDADPSSHTIYASRQCVVNMAHGATGGGDNDYMYFVGLDFRIGREGVVKTNYNDDYTTFSHCNISRMAWTVESGNGGVVWSVTVNGAQWGTHNSFIGCDISWAKDADAGNGNGAGASIYSQHHMLFDSCTIHHIQGTGIYFKVAYPTNDIPKIRDTASVVRFSTFENIGRYGVEFYRKNYYDSAYGNIFINVVERAFDINQGSITDNDGAVFIGNNTFYLCVEALNCRWDDVLSANKFMYNAYYDRSSSGTELIFDNYESNGLDAFSVIDSNIWHDPDNIFNVSANSTSYTLSTWQALGWDVNSDTTSPGFNDPGNGDFSRPSASNEMDVTYGGRTWTVFGAVQPTDSNCETPGPTTLLYPSDGFVFDIDPLPPGTVPSASDTLTLTWDPYVGVDITYRLQVSDNNSFVGLMARDIIIENGTSYGVDGWGGSLLSGTSYYWRVIVRSGSCESTPSASRQFSLNDMAPPGEWGE